MEAFIANVVLACPDGRWVESTAEDGTTQGRWEGEMRDLGEFYGALLGTRIIRDDWIKVGRTLATFPQVAIGDGPQPNYRAPRWPDPEHPQQMHMDLVVPDLDEAGRLALDRGATLLQDKGDYRTYADPFGHPFCLYRDLGSDGFELVRGEAGNQLVPAERRIGRVVIDCFSPRALAAFYEELLDMRRVGDDPDFVVIAREDGRAPMLAFQHAQGPAPRWPDPAHPQQVHLDIYFEDANAARDLAVRLGARQIRGFVFADPAGHPVCLLARGQ